MKTPVLIAARNEASTLGRTLQALPSEVEPIVIPNGCLDATAQIAEDYGARVLDCPTEGKLPALQVGITYLDKRATEPFLTLDADSYPLRGKAWFEAMMRGRQRLDTEKPAVVIGGLLFRDMGLLDSAWRNAGHWPAQIGSRRDDQRGYFCGRNMLLHLNSDELVEQVLDLPHVYPEEDILIKDTVVEAGGQTIKLLGLSAITGTSDPRFPGVWARLRMGRAAYVEQFLQSYKDDAAPGSIPYAEYKALRQAPDSRVSQPAQ